MPYIDLATNASVAQAFKPALVAADTTANAEMDTRGYSYALVIVNSGVWAGDGQLDIYVCASDTTSFTPATANRISGAQFTQIDATVATSMNAVEYGGIELNGCGRYLNLELDYTGTGGTSHDGDVGVTVILIPEDTGSVPTSTQTFRTTLKFDVQP
jgi:hypothetical protein